MKIKCARCDSLFYSTNNKLPRKCPYCGSPFFKIVKEPEDRVENISILNKGVYKINIENILKEKNVFVIKTNDGQYHITLK